jgi:hypothetical protein
MSDSSRLSGINVVTWIVGSGLIVFAVNTIYSDYIKMPKIDINMDKASGNSPTGTVTASIWIVNSDGGPASNLTISLTSSDLTISDPKIKYYDEDIKKVITIPEGDKKLLVTAPRLVYLGQGLNIEATLKQQQEPPAQQQINNSTYAPEKYLRNYFFPPFSTVDVFVASDKTSATREYFVDTTDGIQPTTQRNPFSFWEKAIVPFLTFIAIPAIIFVLFILPHLISKIRAWRAKRFQKEFVKKIIKEIVYDKNILERPESSANALTTEAWNSKSSDKKQATFKNYKDFNKIDRFYSALQQRHLEVLQSGADGNTLVHNRECINLADDVLKNIEWTRYRKTSSRKKNFLITILTIILGSIASSIGYNFLPAVFFGGGFITSVIITGTITLLIARWITKYYVSSTVNIQENNLVFVSKLPRNEVIKLVVISLI